MNVGGAMAKLTFLFPRLIVVMYQEKQRKKRRDISRTMCKENLSVIVHIVNGRGGFCMLLGRFER